VIPDGGVAAGVFATRLELPSMTMNLVEVEDAYRLDIVPGNRLIKVQSAQTAMVTSTEKIGHRLGGFATTKRR
jgi:hypothetical protein